MNYKDVILKAMATKLTCIDAAEIAGKSVHNMQRKQRACVLQRVLDKRRRKRSYHRLSIATAERARP
jgi:hypothetical protein